MSREKPISSLREILEELDSKIASQPVSTSKTNAEFREEFINSALLRLLECFEQELLLDKQEMDTLDALNRKGSWADGWNAYRQELIKLIEKARKGVK